MVREIERFTEGSVEESPQNQQFPDSSEPTSPAGNPVFYRTYSRRTSLGRESWDEVCSRTIEGLIKLGKLNPEEVAIIDKMQRQKKTFPSGRWLWVGGTPWLENPKNFSGGYNCTSTNVIDWRAFGLMMDLAMMGCGTGAILEPKYIEQLPAIRNRLTVDISHPIGTTPPGQRLEETQVTVEGNTVTIKVGDSRQGWVKSYQTLLELSSDETLDKEIEVRIDLSDVRPAGEDLSGFGGVANPVKLPELYPRCANILNKSIGRQLNSVECCLLIDEAAVVVVAGNVRRCIAYGERVSAISGMKPIQDIAIGELVLTSSGEYKPVTDKFLQGVQDVVEIRTPETSIRCTANHRVAVYDGLQSYTWKYAGELQPGDRLISVPHRQGMPCSTTDYAWLVGFFIGDGHTDIASSKRRNGGGGCVAFAFSKARLNGVLGQKCLRILQSLGYTPAISLNENHAWIKVHRKQLADELIEYKQPWATPVIPEFVWLGTEEIRGAFLAGLADADAGPYALRARERTRNVLLNSNKLEFLRQVQRLALSLGIATTLHERSQKMLRGRDTVYEGCHWLKIRGIQSQVNAVALVNPYMGRTGFQICAQKKNGLSLPHQFIEEAMASGWTATTASQTKNIINPSKTGNPKRDANWDTLLSEGIVNPHWLPLEVQLVVPVGQAETFDIEVESDREFIASGLLVHNSAGMRQFAADDALGSNAKDNLWQQDENGNWRIDPERDALRMANHTRVFHHKPNLQESIDAVQKQYYSGEGAIQWAGEAVARANIDLLSTPELKTDFIKDYAQGKGSEWLRSRYPNLDDKEIEHRLGRYGLNPCLTADTWIHTENGARQIKDLIGKQRSLYVNGELFSTTAEGFFCTGVKPVLKVETKEGYSLRLTGNHQLLKVTAQTQKSQYAEWVETEKLQVGDRILIHNHRGMQPWQGEGTFEEGWLLGNLIGDGCFLENPENHAYQAKLRYWGEEREVMKDYALTVAQSLPNAKPARGHFHNRNQYYEISSAALFQLAARYGISKGNKTVTKTIEEASYNFCRGFLRGIYDADGSVQGTQQKGISVCLAQSNLALLEAVQRMLLRMGIGASIYRERRQAGLRSLPDSQRKLKEYWCKSQHELVIANDNLPIFAEIIGFQEPSKAERLQLLLSGYKRNLNRERFTATIAAIREDGVEQVYDCTVPSVNRFDANGIVAHNCGEIIGADFHCNLAEIHLNQLNSADEQEQKDAFTAGALAVATLLNHQFQEQRYQYSRELDPIVGVSFTGLFDFFVNAFGVNWLKWWEAGRLDTPEGREFKQKEEAYLTRWKDIVQQVVWDYCDRHNIKRPNRCTTLQPAGTKSLLTGASPGWHPPKAQRFIRRITFAKNDPVALACLEYGYGVVPAQSDKDENGHLLDDPFDPRCTEWLVEIPVEVPWANLPGASEIEISKFSALAQMDFYLQVQRHWTTHNTSATVELTGEEVQALGERIHQAIQNDEGYISVALLARFEDHQSFPRLPFEPISKETYTLLSQQVLSRRQNDDFYSALLKYDNNKQMEAGPAGCDSDKCMFPDLGANQ